MKNHGLLKILSIVFLVVIISTMLVACDKNNDAYDFYMPDNLRPSLFRKPKEIVFNLESNGYTVIYVDNVIDDEMYDGPQREWYLIAKKDGQTQLTIDGFVKLEDAIQYEKEILKASKETPDLYKYLSFGRVERAWFTGYEGAVGAMSIRNPNYVPPEPKPENPKGEESGENVSDPQNK